MAWRFQPSKFKNTAPKMPKKEETVFDVPVGTLSCMNNGIASNEGYIAFCIEGEGGKLGVVPSDARGRRLRKDIDVVCAHNEQVDDFSFLPFVEDKLVTCSRDEKVKVWTVSAASPSALSGEIDLGAGRLLTALRPHSTASDILAVASTAAVHVLDLARGAVVADCDGAVEKALCVDWSEDGRLLAAAADKGRQGVIWDPRAGTSACQTLEMHGGMGREARCLFAGQRFVSTGFTNKRVQEVRVWDTRSWAKPVHIGEYTATTGVLMPAYDPDTKLLFLAGKGTNKIFLAEIQDKAPILSDVNTLTTPDQVLGVSLAPKRSVNVMDGEVCRLYQLTKNAVIPIPCIVPRRSYRELHMELFPDTRGPIASCSSEAWLEGCNDMPEKVSMVADHGGSSSDAPPEPTPPILQKAPPAAAASTTTLPAEPTKPAPITNEPREHVYEPTVRAPGMVAAAAAPVSKPRLSKQNSDEKAETSSLKENVPEPKTAAPPPSTISAMPVKMRVLAQSENEGNRSLLSRVRPRSCVVGQVQSKYRHVETLAGVKAGAVFTNLRNVNTRLPTECNGAVVSAKYAAVPLAGPAGVIAILDLDKAQKMPDGVVDGIYNKAQVTDLAWSPFDSSLLAVSTDTGTLNLWRIPAELAEDERRADLEPERVLKVGRDKVVCVRWHPLAEGLIAVAFADGAVELWTTGEGASRRARMHAHTGPVLSMAWSAGGRRLATVAKDLEAHVWTPQTSTDAMEARLSGALESMRGARVLFACDDTLLVIVGLTKSSGRQISLHDARNSSLPLLHRQHVDNAVQPLMPHYDYDSSVLFLSGKGDQSVQMFEVSGEPPFLLPLMPFNAPTGHQSLAFHNKSACQVMDVEFARAWRLTEKSLELLKFRVPRVKKDLFQSDIFPDALVTWDPATSADSWLTGDQTPPRFVSLRPEGVPALSLPAISPTPSADGGATKQPRAPVSHQRDPPVEQPRAERPEQKEVMSAWSAQIEVDGTLEQDRMEGVAEEEWSQ